ncbi:MAG: hypothetical protein ACI38U_15875 [Corynebacterium sp.]|uniref:hypothetical protein n=1 Tax=unclassified Corynebacterium TaxID=2624378 RepID=UPI0009638B69|nr:hypothetical protein [Corynebacterium sp. CNJ-954]OLT53802.1 hypothetical protein BJF89_03155 [Corynebacterium sp. CNJ-954]
MPTMFPVSHNSDPGDRNRAIRYWKPGDGTPGSVKTAVVLFLIAAVGLLVSGAMMWTADRPVVDDADQMAYVETLSSNMKWVGSIQILAALVIALLIPALVRGNGRRRRWLMITASVAMGFTLVGWVFNVGGLEQPLLALAMALGALAMYRPAVRTFFGESPSELEG